MPLAGLEYSYKNDQITSSNLYYLHSDHLNTPRLATNAAQKIVNWGQTMFSTVSKTVICPRVCTLVKVVLDDE